MKRFIVLAMMVLALAVGCDDKNTGSLFENDSMPFPAITANTHKELFAHSLKKSSDEDHGLQDVAMYFAVNKKWLKKAVLNEAKDRGVPVTDLADDARTSELELDGIRYVIKLSLLNEAKAEMLSQKDKEFSYAVGLDPDMFYPDQSEMQAYLWNAETWKIEEQTIPIVSPSIEASKVEEIQSVKNALSFPVFLVSIEESEPEENIRHAKSLRGLGKSTAAAVFERHPYLALYEVKLKEKEDYAEEEFEMFYTGVNTWPVIGMYTDMLFNGNSRADAAGRSVYFPDINGTNTYTCPQWIAVANLDYWTSNDFRMVAIENDDNSGKIKVQGGGEYLAYNTQNFKTGLTQTGTDLWEYDTDGNGGWPFNDDDDVYKQSGLSNVKRTNLETELGSRTYFNTDDAATDLEDVNYKLGLQYYPAFLSCGISPQASSAPIGNTQVFYANAGGASGSYTYKWESYVPCSGGPVEANAKSDGNTLLKPPCSSTWQTISTGSYIAFTPSAGSYLRVTVTDTQSGEVVVDTEGW